MSFYVFLILDKYKIIYDIENSDGSNPLEEVQNSIFGLKQLGNYLEKYRDEIIDDGIKYILDSNNVYATKLKDIKDFKLSLEQHFEWMIYRSSTYQANLTNYKSHDILAYSIAYCDFYNYMLRLIEDIEESKQVVKLLKRLFIYLQKEYCKEGEDNTTMTNRTKFEYIKEKLIHIHSRVTIDSAFKLYDINITSEDMFMHIMNDVYGLELINANKIKDNFPAVDLIDEKNRIMVQVTSSISTTKINKTLKGIEKFRDDDRLKKYANYRLKFLYIIEDRKDFTDNFKSKNNLTDENFLDITDILKDIQGKLDIEAKVYETLRKIFVDKVDSLGTKSVDEVNKGRILENNHIIYRDGYIEPRTVNIEESDISIAVCPVTVEEYYLFCKSTNIKMPYGNNLKKNKRPAINIDWNQAQKYCKWLQEKTTKLYRLPTSKEWESIALSNMPDNDLEEYIVCREDFKKNPKIAKVGTKKAGKLNIFDMPGNIHEWCSDNLNNNEKIVKGSTFNTSLKNIDVCRNESFDNFHSNNNLGFRVVL